MTIDVPLGAGNVTSANNGNANNITVNKPSNTADGDVLVAAMYFRNDVGTVTKPSGWTQIGPLNQTFETFGMYYKAIPSASAETATDYNFSTSAGSNRAMGIIFRVTGADLAGIADSASALADYAQYTSCLIPATTAVAGQTMLLALAITNNATTGAPSLYSAPAGMTTVDQESADTGVSTSNIWVGKQLINAAGSTGTRTPTISPQALNAGGFMVTIKGLTTATVTLGVDRTVGSRSLVTLAATLSGGTATAWNWAQTTGTPVTLGGSGATRTFTAPATINGDVLTFTVTAVVSGVATAPADIVITAAAHQWWVLRDSGWQPFAMTVL